VPQGLGAVDGTLALCSADPEWLRGFLSRGDVREALAPLCARAGDDPSFPGVRAGRGRGGSSRTRTLVGSRSGLFFFRDP
jgi:hypothetical protein